ncbi:hypothetical protein CW304_29295 [Bacillus sp. UFRGS-B20]|nr:hypothetical protein CW304_29295 [Bacillus sp. UFRGS-B20]
MPVNCSNGPPLVTQLNHLLASLPGHIRCTEKIGLDCQKINLCKVDFNKSVFPCIYFQYPYFNIQTSFVVYCLLRTLEL